MNKTRPETCKANSSSSLSISNVTCMYNEGDYKQWKDSKAKLKVTAILCNNFFYLTNYIISITRYIKI